MEAESTIGIEQVLQDYAVTIGHDQLSDTEKQQAVLNAILDGKRVEPFATYVEEGQRILRSLVSRECWEKIQLRGKRE